MHCCTCGPGRCRAGKPPVLSVSPHVPALLAYAQLAGQQVSGAPVVTDADGELIANLSISDIRWGTEGGRGGRVGLVAREAIPVLAPPRLPAPGELPQLSDGFGG